MFLGLERPPLQSAVDVLMQRHRVSVPNIAPDDPSPTAATLDLSNLLIVLPTTRGCKRLMQLLAAKCLEDATVFSPPRMITIGELPECLYVPDQPLASDLTQQICWSRALRRADSETMAALLGRDGGAVSDGGSEPGSDDLLQQYQPLAKLLSRMHSRLGSDVWSFRSVAREVRTFRNFLADEQARWDALEKVQGDYYRMLGEAGLWDRQAARSKVAVGSRPDIDEVRCHCDHDIVLVAVADLNRSTAGMLKQLRPQVSCLVAADESMADRFDEFGSLITSKWLDAPIPIENRRIRVVDTPADQAAMVTHYLTHVPGGQPLASDEITIGVPDDSVTPQIQRELQSLGVPIRRLSGTPLSETAPVRLLMAMREYLIQPTWDAFATLMRHPDLFDWISETVEDNSWLQLMDAYQNGHLPDRLSVRDPQPFGSDDVSKIVEDPKDPNSANRQRQQANEIGRLNQLAQTLNQLLEPLYDGTRPLAQWSGRWSDVLQTIYGNRTIDRNRPQDRATLRALESLTASLVSQNEIPDQFETTATAPQSLQWALEAANEQAVPSVADPQAIDLCGWLDLTLDDARLLIVTGMNDDCVPSSEVGHQFLPNALCESLGILDNNRRYARDCYALTVMTSVRDEYFLIVGRRNENDEPKKPSRLLFADAADVAAVRARAFFQFRGKEHSRIWLGDEKQIQHEQSFAIPLPQCPKPPSQLSVTKFKEYLQCPYRFYLNIILKLRSTRDDWPEMDGGTFGDLAHNVLEAFAESELRDSSNAQMIFQFLSGELDEQIGKIYSASRLPAVRIQIEQLRLRLERFAEIQADHRRSGWRIVSTEELLAHKLSVKGQPFTLTGKIDRVDMHEHTGQVAIWDYKTSDAGEGPYKHHKTKSQWKDLQLPLYRHLVKEVNAVRGANLDDITVGYVLLSKDLENIKFEAAEFSQEELAEADALAMDCIEKIRAGLFWPPVEKPPKFSESLAGICQDDVFEQFPIEQHTPEDLATVKKSSKVKVSGW